MIISRPDLAGGLRSHDLRQKPIKQIVIHRNTVSDLWFKDHPKDDKSAVEAASAWFQEADWRLFPYHFFIDRPGRDGQSSITQVHTLDTIAPHAHGVNQTSIGVALNVDGRKRAPPHGMQIAAVWLLAHLLAMHPDVRVIRHSAIAAKQCPGTRVPVEQITEDALFFSDPCSQSDLEAARIMETREWK